MASYKLYLRSKLTKRYVAIYYNSHTIIADLRNYLNYLNIDEDTMPLCVFAHEGVIMNENQLILFCGVEDNDTIDVLVNYQLLNCSSACTGYYSGLPRISGLDHGSCKCGGHHYRYTH